MVATILAVNQIGVEGGAKSEIGEARFLMRGLAISPPRFSRFCERAFPPDFFEKKKLAGTLGVDPLLEGALSVLGAESDVYVTLAPPPTYSATFVTTYARILRRTISPALISIGTLLRITARMSTTQ